MPPSGSVFGWRQQVATQRAARSTGSIELDVGGATLRLRGPVDEASLCSVLRALRQIT
jgi:transposase